MTRYQVNMRPRDRKRGGAWNPDMSPIVTAASEAEACQRAFDLLPDLRGVCAITSVVQVPA